MKLTYEERQLLVCALRCYLQNLPGYLTLTQVAAEKLLEKLKKNMEGKR
jgi:hypothetical protein